MYEWEFADDRTIETRDLVDDWGMTNRNWHWKISNREKTKKIPAGFRRQGLGEENEENLV
jgi:hypothetical protein